MEVTLATLKNSPLWIFFDFFSDHFDDLIWSLLINSVLRIILLTSSALIFKTMITLTHGESPSINRVLFLAAYGLLVFFNKATGLFRNAELWVWKS